MNRYLISALLSVILGDSAAAHQLTCPAQSPAAWGTPQTPLVEADVLVYPANIPRPPDDALPYTIFHDQRERHGIVYQTWNMNTEPGDEDQVYCLYTREGKDHALRLDANHVKHCWSELRYQGIKIIEVRFFCD